MRNIIILLLFASSCSAQTGLYHVVNGKQVAFTQAEITQWNIDQTNARAQFKNDSIAEVRKKNALTTLQSLYDANVKGTDVRQLTAAQQRIVLGIVLMKLELVDTSFKMK